MKVGDYVRTKWGCIAKFEGINEGFYEFDNIIMDESSAVSEELFVDIVKKSSPNIIDLIKEHDLLRLYDVEYGEEYITEVVIDSADMLSVSNYDCDNFLHLVQELMTNEHIKLISIVTSEQFSQMEYRIGE